MALVAALDAIEGISFTENGDRNVGKLVVGNDRDLGRLLEIFSSAVRGKSNMPNIEALLQSPTPRIKELLLVLGFYLRDIDSGQGERDLFREVILAFWNAGHHDIVKAIVPLIPQYGYWKDIPKLIAASPDDLAEFLIAYHVDQFNQSVLAIQNEGTVDIGVGKYMPRHNASRSSAPLAYRYAKVMFPAEEKSSSRLKRYRQQLQIHSNHFQTVERQLCQKDFDAIRFETVPSVAMSRYQSTFSNVKKGKIRSGDADRVRLADRFKAYLDSVKAGNGKINSKAIQLTDFPILLQEGDAAIEIQFDAYLDQLRADSSLKNSLSIVDVSGSMCMAAKGTKSLVIDIAIMMGIATSKLADGPWHDRMISFSKNPSWINISECKTYHDAFAVTKQSPWGMNTDFRAVFNLILDTAVENKVEEVDMPKLIFVYSDMQFDAADRQYQSSHDDIVAKYALHGYKLPHIIYWNLADCRGHPVGAERPSVSMVSGFSLALMKLFMSGKIEELLARQAATPLDLMLEVLEGERYEPVWNAIRTI